MSDQPSNREEDAKRAIAEILVRAPLPAAAPASSTWVDREPRRSDPKDIY